MVWRTRRSTTISGPIEHSNRQHYPERGPDLNAMTFLEQHQVPRVVNTLGTSTIVGERRGAGSDRGGGRSAGGKVTRSMNSSAPLAASS